MIFYASGSTKTRKRRIVLLALALFMTALPVYTVMGDDAGLSPFRLNIFMDRSTFTVDDPVMLHLIVRNSSERKENFIVYDELYTTFQPVVFTSRGREAEIIVPYKLKNTPAEELIRDRIPRMIELMPNETFVYSVDLRVVYSLEKDVEYRVKGFAAPDYRNSLTLASENDLRFRITRTPDFAPRSGIARVKREVSPSEVVLLALTAEKEEKWENYFKYIKTDVFINAYPEFVRLYNSADEIEKLKILEDFTTFLKRKRPDYIKDFTMLTEDIMQGRNIAYVDVKVARYGSRMPFVYKYRYTLEKYQRLWLIIDLDATVVKGE